MMKTGKSEFGQELLDLFQEKKNHIMALEQVTEFEPDEEQIAVTKYGVAVTVEHKGQFIFEKGKGPSHPSQNKENSVPPSSISEKSRHMVHPSLLKKEIAQEHEGGVEIRPIEDSTPKKKGVKFSADTPKACRGEKIRLGTPDKRQPALQREFGNFGEKDFEAQAIMQQISDDFVVDETSMKVLMDGDGFDALMERQNRDFKTPNGDAKKESENSESTLRRLSQTVKNKVDKTRRRSSVFLEATTKRLSMSTPKFLRRSKTVSKHPEPNSFAGDSFTSSKPIITNVAEFEANLQQLQDVYTDMDREVLRDLLIKAGGQLERAIDLYTAQQIRF